MTDSDVEAIKSAKETLMQSAQNLFAKMYEAAQQTAGANGAPNGDANANSSYNADDVVDGDYKEV